MPIFEYACNGCGHAFETLVRSGTVPACPQCHGTELHKLLSVPAKPADNTGMALPASPCGSCDAPGSHTGCPFASAMR
ncbi:MAG: FmdB family zinc ribbon protein [Burkholderiaceae bacterium]|jgi:putative FmdB family regulatory protein